MNGLVGRGREADVEDEDEDWVYENGPHSSRREDQPRNERWGGETARELDLSMNPGKLLKRCRGALDEGNGMIYLQGDTLIPASQPTATAFNSTWHIATWNMI